MCKSEIAEALSEKGYFKGETKTIVNDVFDIIQNAIIRGEKVSISNFGTFGVKMRKGHTSQNISTGELRMLDDHNVPYFRPSANLKSAVRKGASEQTIERA